MGREEGEICMGECGKEQRWSVPAVRWPRAGLGAPAWGHW